MLSDVEVSAGSSPGDDPREDWQWQCRHTIRTVDELAKVLCLTDGEMAAARYAETHGFPLAITPHYLALCDREDPHCPIRRQVVPLPEELDEVAGDLRDPLGEEEHEVAPGLVRRYPDRALLLFTDHCATYCRFCTRRRRVGRPNGFAGESPHDRHDRVLAYLRDNPAIRELIVSGGDPLIVPTARLERLLAAVRTVPSIEVIRIATRTPVTLPQRITEELVNVLRKFQPIWIMTHFNHPKELVTASRRACARLVDAGFPVMNQTVLLRGVNDDANTLTTLFRGLVRERVRPYYLLQGDPVRGTGHLRTPVDVGLKIMQKLQGNLSGLAIPRFILDAPGGLGKVPLLPEYIVSRHDGVTRVRTHRGVEADYTDPPESTQS